MFSTVSKKLLSLLTVVAMVFSMVAVVQPMQADAATVEIPIANGDFENGAFGGAVSGSNGASIVEKATYEGNYALKFDATGEILTVTGYLPEATTAESTVTLSFMAKVLAGSTQNSVNFGLFATNASWGNRVQKYGAGYPVVGGDWKQITQTLTVPAETKIIQAQIYLGAAGATAIIDNVSITDGNGAEILQSGGFEKGALNGDFNANDALEIVKTPVHGGKYAAHADKSSGNGNITTTVTFTPSAKERTMQFSFWMYAPTSVNSVHTMVVCFDTSSGSWTNLSTKYGAQYATPGTWVQKTMEIAVAANTNTLQIQLYAQDAGADFYIDDLKLTEEVADVVNHNASLSLNQVTNDGTWQFSFSETPANKYYKVPAIIDGIACNFLMGESGGIMCVYPNFFTALGGVVPAETLIIEEGAVLKAVDSTAGWAEIEGADTYTLTEKIDLSYVNGAWGKTVYNTDVALTLNQVTGDGTWQFTISKAPFNKYYKVPAIIDGVACNFLMGESGGMMCVYPNFFTALGGAVPTETIIIEEGTVLKAVDSANGWKEIEGANTLTVTDKIDLSYANGVWGKTVYNQDITVTLNQVTGDGTWQFNFTGTPTNKYYKAPVTIDGDTYDILVGESGGMFCVYPSFFTALGGIVPTETFLLEAGTVLKAVDSTNGWKEIADAETLTVTEKVDLTYANGAWGITVVNVDTSLSFSQVTGDGTWQLTLGSTLPHKYYKLPAVVDGELYNIAVSISDTMLIIYPNFFGVFGGIAPDSTLEIPAGTVMTAVDSNGWKDLPASATIQNRLVIENIGGSWLDMTRYADVVFTDISASDILVYKWEDQSAEQYRSVLGIYSETVFIPSDENWGNFVKVTGKVLVDGVQVNVTFGMVPGVGDSSWGIGNGILLYITGEGYRDAVSSANTVTICAGTTLISGVDASLGFRFTEDVVLYKNCDGSWDTTADTHVYNRQNTELAGALVSDATCQSPAVYCYSCACGLLGTETFTYGELGDHNYVNGTCGTCGDTLKFQNITVSLQTITGDGTWQLVPNAAPAAGYYKLPVTIDGVSSNVLVQYSGGLLLIYPNFFTALGDKAPAESFKVAEGAVMKAVDAANGWAELENTTSYVFADNLDITFMGGKWVEFSKYENVNFTEVYAADLDMYYYNIMRAGDYSDAEIAAMKLMYPEYAKLLDIYGRDANMTTFGIKSVNPALLIPNDASWANFTLLGAIQVQGASPVETYVMMTPDSSDDAETAMTNGFLVRFYNGFVGDVAVSVTFLPGTRLVAKDGVTGFVFVDGYTLYQDCQGNWSDNANIHSFSAWNIDKEATYTQVGQMSRTCANCGEVETQVISVLVNPVAQWNIVLRGNIGVNFEMALAETDVVTATVNGAAVNVKKILKGDGLYTVSVEVAAAQMNDAIVLSVNGNEIAATYSVRGYADVILSGNYSTETQNLVKYMLVYGGAAQSYFGHNADNLASSGIEISAYTPDGDTDVAISGNANAISFYGATLMHRTNTAIRFYFVADSMDGYTVEANADYVIGQKDGMYYVEIADILPQDLGNVFTVSVSDGANTLTVSYSALTYIVRMYQKETSTAANKALVQALYGYYLASVAYAA